MKKAQEYDFDNGEYSGSLTVDDNPNEETVSLEYVRNLNRTDEHNDLQKAYNELFNRYVGLSRELALKDIIIEELCEEITELRKVKK